MTRKAMVMDNTQHTIPHALTLTPPQLHYGRNNTSTSSPETHQFQSVSIKRSLPTDESSQYSYPPESQRVTHPLTARPRSPDLISKVSTSSSQAGPQLRKKPKTISISSSRTPAKPPPQEQTPNLHSVGSPDDQTIPTTAHNSANSGKPLLRTHSGNLLQSTSSKKPPASHSSYGVETTCGPPPSYSTQRTLSTERVKKVERTPTTRMISAQTTISGVGTHDGLEGTGNSTGAQVQTSAVSHVHSSPDTTDTQSVPTPTDDEQQMSHFSVRGDHETNRANAVEDGKESSSDERRSEDLFLNIAKIDAARSSTSRADRRRSRISLPFVPTVRPRNENRISPSRARFDSTEPSQPEAIRYLHKRSSLGQQLSGAYTHDSDRLRDHSAGPSSDAERYDTRSTRRASNANVDPARVSQRSSQALRSMRLVSEPAHIIKPRTEEHVATESTISTTAPSTVWDELDDLKSRIRKLELTGKLPSSSAAAMSSAERPRTATTAATTMSGSPQHKPSMTTLQSPMEGISQNVHPLLHEALGNAKQVLSNEIYQKLYATAQDALQLAAMMSNESGTTNPHVVPAAERQIKRRTESMCRGLTELTIALAADSRSAASDVRPISRDSIHPPNTMLRSRRYSNDPGDRIMPSRVHSRLDSRRTSVHLGHLQIGSAPSEVRSRDSSTVLPQLPGLRLSRTATVTRTRPPGHYDGVNDDLEDSPSFRAASRAMTDIGGYPRTSRDYTSMSREYTSQHPMPSRMNTTIVSSTPLPSGVSTNFTSRRKYASPASVVVTQDNSPMTPRDAPFAQDAWGRITLVPGGSGDNASPDTMSETLANSTGRSGSSRRSLGFAGRIGSSVGSRLRAVRAERTARENIDSRSMKDIAPSFTSDREDEGVDTGSRER